MPASMATKLGIQFARFAQYTAASAASTNPSATHSLRNAFSSATSNGATPPWAQGLSSGGGASANSTGIGGAKFQAGRGAHSSFQTGRSIANANASSANDGSAAVSDEEDDVSLLSMHGAARIHRPSLQEGRRSIFQSGLRSRMTDTTSNLQLILPNHHGLYISRARAISTSRPSEKSVSTLTRSSSEMERGELLDNEANSRQRSLSTSATASQDLGNAAITNETTPSAMQGIAIGGQATSSASATLDRVDSDGDSTSVMYDDLRRAIDTGKEKVISSAVGRYRKLPKQQLSTPSFNLAMEATSLLKHRGFRRWENNQTILDMYSEMLDHNCTPSFKTRAIVISALCSRDRMRMKMDDSDIDGLEQNEDFAQSDLESSEDKANSYERSDVDFKQALALMDLTHTLGFGFTSNKVYNEVLVSCQLRGDVKSACHIIDLLSANKEVKPDSLTFHRLLAIFNSDKSPPLPGETPQECNIRKLEACKQVFEEFEVFRSADVWNVKDYHILLVWNLMIKIHFQRGDAVGAIKLIEQLVGVKKSEEGLKPTPAPNSSTTRAIIVGFMDLGDLAAAASWFERLAALNSEVKSNEEKSIMPLPDYKMVTKLIQTISDRIFSVFGKEKGQKEVEGTVDEYLPMVEAANRGMDLLYKKVSRDLSSNITGQRLPNERLMKVNNILAEALMKEGRKESADTLMDHSLTLIEQRFEKHPDQVNGSNSNTLAEARIANFTSKDICETIHQLTEMGRWHDGAACLSYAAFALPPYQNAANQEGIKDQDMINLSKHAYRGFRSAAYAVMADSSASTEDGEEDFQLKQGANAKLHLDLTVKYVLPVAKELSYNPRVLRNKVRKLFQLVRQQGDLMEMNLNALDWNHLIYCYTRKLHKLQKDDISLDELKSFFADLAVLPEEIKRDLHLQDAVLSLPHLFGNEDALSLLQSIRSSITLDNVENHGYVRGYGMSSMADGQSDASATGLTSPTTAITSLEGEIESHSSPASIDFAPADFVVRPIQTIDVDLGQRLVNECRDLTKTRPFVLEAKAVERIYNSMMKSIDESGNFPSPNAISSLINLYGRLGDLEKLKEVYTIGTHIVAALGGDPGWQMEASYELEDGMIAALAHGGDPKSASDLRHRLINSGRVPRADTYAALITVIRDTTDDALVAEELFEESQRLGVRSSVYLYNTLLSKLSRARKAERAFQLFEDMRNRGLSPSSITYGAILNACTRTGDEVNAEKFFSMMESDHKFRPGIPPFNTMIQFYTQTKPNREKALFYYQKTLKFKLQPTSHTYKLLLDVYGSIAPIDMGEMNTIFGKLIADRNVTVQGNHWASLIIAHGIHAKNLDQAINLYQAIPQHVATVKAGKKGQEPDALAFEALLSVFLEHKRLDLIERYIEERKIKGCEMTAYVANVLIKAYSAMDEVNGLNRARSVFEEMRDPPMGVAAAGNHPLARQHVSGAHHDELSSSSVNVGFAGLSREPSTFETMMKVEMDHGNTAEATALIERMQYRGYPPVVVARVQEAMDSHAKVV